MIDLANIAAMAEQYRTNAQDYTALAVAETDPNRRKAFEVLADTYNHLAAAYDASR
jgi:hypothetical protein